MCWVVHTPTRSPPLHSLTTTGVQSFGGFDNRPNADEVRFVPPHDFCTASVQEGVPAWYMDNDASMAEEQAQRASLAVLQGSMHSSKRDALKRRDSVLQSIHSDLVD